MRVSLLPLWVRRDAKRANRIINLFDGSIVTKDIKKAV